MVYYLKQCYHKFVLPESKLSEGYVMKQQKRLPYSVGVVAIVCIVAAIFSVIIMAINVKSSHQSLEMKIEGIENAIGEMSTNPDVDSDSALLETVNYELNNIKAEYDGFIGNLTVILSVFALLVTICTIIMPLYTYNFLQKDQIEQFRSQMQQEIQTVQNSLSTFTVEFNENQKNYKAEFEKQIKKLQSTTASLDDLFSPFDFDDVRIEPIYSITSEDLETYYRKAIVAFCLGKKTKSLEMLNVVLLTYPQNKEALLSKAKVLYSMDDYDASIETLNELIRLDHNSYNYYYRGCVKYTAKMYPAAVVDLRFAYNQKPCEQFMIKLAAALHKDRKTQEAIIYQSRAIELNGGEAQYYADRGIMYHALKQYEDALADKMHAINLSGNNGQFYGIYAATLCKAKRYQESIVYSNNALSKDSKLAFVYSFRGLAKAYLPDEYTFEDATNDLNVAIELDATNYRNFYRRAEAHIISATGDLDIAFNDLERAQNMNPKDPEIMYLLSLLYEKRSDTENAKKCLNDAHTLGYIPEPKC